MFTFHANTGLEANTNLAHVNVFVIVLLLKVRALSPFHIEAMVMEHDLHTVLRY